MNRLTLVVLMVWVGLGGASTTSAQPFETIYSFGSGPANPSGNLTLGPDGSFYGTTAAGGQYGDGTVFRVTTAGNLMTLVSFGSTLNSGTFPSAGLTLGADGNLYGTTTAGGTNRVSGTNNTGTIFRLSTNGTLTTLVNFTGINGSYPECQLTIGPNGSFYGTTAYGGTSNLGTVFQVTTNGVLTTLASFGSTNGAMPQAGLTLGLDGNFYGTTSYGGISNVGTIFQVTPGGNLKTLVNFNSTNGAVPYGQLTLGSDGALYGTTFSGGISSGPFQVTSNSSVGVFGTVFRVTTSGTLTTLADLTMHGSYGGIYPGLDPAMGWNPYGKLIQGADGNLYGTTSGGGTNGTGTIFRVSTNSVLDQLSSLPNLQFQFLTNFLGYVYVNYTTNNWTNSSLTLSLNASVKKLYDFPPLVNTTNSTGAESRSGLTLGLDGNFYAAVYRGGAGGYGTIIRVATNGATTPLASFSGNTGSGLRAGLTQGPDGSLYGAAQLGGVNNIGTLFKWSRDGSVSTLHSFDWRPDGANPNASLTLGPDGNLYGTALNGGTNLMQTGPNSYDALSLGTVFRLTTNGIFTPLVYFNGTNGANPYDALTLLNGSFYGTTAYGGISNSGTVFQMTTNGALTVLDSFTGANGSHPYGKLTVGPNGHLYGMTGFGGISNVGTVFEISTQGPINTILHFTGTNGANPQSGLFWNSDGYFYGAAQNGGSRNLGTLFKLTPSGVLTTLTSFGLTNGAFPEGDLIKGPDGNLYGATPQGGTGFNGTVFRINANDTVTTLFSFPSTPLNSSFSSGYRPYSGFILYTNGNSIRLYGTAYGGGNNGGGTIFEVNLTTFYTVPENTATLLNPLTNDVLWTTSGSLNLLSTSTTNGTATISANRILVSPATNFIGSTTLAYTFTDGAGHTNTSLIGLLVTNLPPVANPDFATVGENSTANLLNPLANDLVQTPGGALGLVNVSTTNGTAAISGTNVLFTPASNYVGTVTVNYLVTDTVGGTNSSFITILVTNAPPTANAQSVVTPENTATAITLTGTDPNHLALTYAIVTGPANGTLFGLNTNTGTVTYQPGTNYNGLDSFTFRVSDGQGESAPAIVSITVTATTATNQPPVANPDFYAITENTTNTFNPLANDQVRSVGGVLSLVALNPTNGTAMISGTNVVFTPAVNFRGTATIGYTITDGLGGSSASLISVTVTNISPLALADQYGIIENTTNVFAVLTNDQALTPGGTLQIISATATNGNVTISGGTNLLFVPAINFLGVARIDYTITDSVGGTNSTTATIVVTNLPPLANPDFYSMGKNSTNTLAPLTNDLVRTPGGSLSIVAVTPTNGTATINGTNLLFTPSVNFVGAATIGYTITDNIGGTNFSLVTVTVTNRPPVANAQYVSTPYSTPLNITLSGTDPDSEPVHFAIVTLPVQGTLTGLNTNSGTVVYTPTNGFTGTDSFVFSVNDGTVSSAPATVTITVGSPAGADLALSVSGPTNVMLNSNLVYNLIVSNTGPATATGVVISNRLPANVTFISASGGATPANGVLLVNLGSLIAGSTGSAQITVQPTVAGALTNQFQVFASQSDPVTNNNVATVVTAVTNAPPLPVDLALNLVAAPNPVAVGSPLTYLLTVSNNSSTTATGVVVSNTLPANTTLFSLLPSQGVATNQSGLVTFNVGNLSNGSAATLTMVVLPNVAGLLTNVAAVFSAQTDSAPGNNRVTNVTTAINVPITNLVLTVVTPMILNPQTGLFEQSVAVVNGGPSTPSSVLVKVAGLAVNARLYNATGATNGLPYVQSTTPLAIGSNVVFLLEFYVPTRVMPTNLTYTAVAGPPFIPPIVNGTIFSINREMVLNNGSMLVEFSATPGQVYAIQYSSDMVSWQTAVPVVTAPANKVQWIDAGPPQTASSPAGQPSRFYRVVRLSNQ
jgi:uncharacterized repeat protein (TIGR01451 family)